MSMAAAMSMEAEPIARPMTCGWMGGWVRGCSAVDGASVIR